MGSCSFWGQEGMVPLQGRCQPRIPVYSTAWPWGPSLALALPHSYPSVGTDPSLPPGALARLWSHVLHPQSLRNTHPKGETPLAPTALSCPWMPSQVGNWCLLCVCGCVSCPPCVV